MLILIMHRLKGYTILIFMLVLLFTVALVLAYILKSEQVKNPEIPFTPPQLQQKSGIVISDINNGIETAAVTGNLKRVYKKDDINYIDILVLKDSYIDELVVTANLDTDNSELFIKSVVQDESGSLTEQVKTTTVSDLILLLNERINTSITVSVVLNIPTQIIPSECDSRCQNFLNKYALFKNKNLVLKNIETGEDNLIEVGVIESVTL